MTKAIAFTEFGPADVLHPLDVELPAPDRGRCGSRCAPPA